MLRYLCECSTCLAYRLLQAMTSFAETATTSTGPPAHVMCMPWMTATYLEEQRVNIACKVSDTTWERNSAPFLLLMSSRSIGRRDLGHLEMAKSFRSPSNEGRHFRYSSFLILTVQQPRNVDIPESEWCMLVYLRTRHFCAPVQKGNRALKPGYFWSTYLWHIYM